MTDGPKRRDLAGRTLTTLILDVFRLNGRLIGAGDRLVGSLGLTSARWQVLGALAMSPSPQTVADIARSMGLTRQSVQRIANELVQRGLLERAENPRHVRAPLMRLTERGTKAYDAAATRQVPWADQLAQNIPMRNIETAVSVLRTLTDRLQGENHTRRGERHDTRRNGSPRTSYSTAR
jgi:DNA-binding MarR family transcriptional regulator